MFSSNAFLISTDPRIKSRNKKESALDLPGMRRISASVDSFINGKVEGGKVCFSFESLVSSFFFGRKRGTSLFYFLAICLIFPSIVTLCCN